jgi:prephenate dehydrogenase
VRQKIGIRRVAIVGLGLIGGSLGMALKRARGAEVEVVGYARSFQKGVEARRRGAVDRSEEELSTALQGAELVVIATPVLAIPEILGQIGKCLPAGCIVTDTASTKAKVMEWAEELLPPGVSFIGGHPMAGKEFSGIEAAEATLFQGCIYCLTPSPGASSQDVEAVAALVREIGARPLLMEASRHDHLVAGISHLPLMLSAALVSATTSSSLWEQMSELAVTGYRDVTRLASQSPRMNRDICLTNAENIVWWLDRVIEELQRIRCLVAQRDEGLEEAFVRVHQARQKWLEEKGYAKKAQSLP